MTECSPETPYLQAILENGLDGIAEAIRELFNEAMKLERENHLQAGRYQRSETRAGYANGYNPGIIPTRGGQSGTAGWYF